MTALAADARRAKYNMDNAMILSVPMAASTTIYSGAIVCWNTSGYAIPGADTAGIRTAGLALEGRVNSGSAGDKNVLVARNVVAPFAIQGGSLAIADSGLVAIIQDDNTATDAATATNDIPFGLIAGVSGSQVLVCVGHGYAHANA